MTSAVNAEDASEASEVPGLENVALDADIGAVQLSPNLSRSLPPLKPPPLAAGLAVEEERDSLGIHSMADCFLRFLDSLAEPVVTFAAYSKALRVERRYDAYRVVESLPVVVSLFMLNLG